MIYLTLAACRAHAKATVVNFCVGAYLSAYLPATKLAALDDQKRPWWVLLACTSTDSS